MSEREDHLNLGSVWPPWKDEPSDEREFKLRRARLWIALIVFVIYPISSGPMLGLFENRWMAILYLPLFVMAEHCPPFKAAFVAWTAIWSFR